MPLYSASKASSLVPYNTAPAAIPISLLVMGNSPFTLSHTWRIQSHDEWYLEYCIYNTELKTEHNFLL
jgi:hypothetical protein